MVDENGVERPTEEALTLFLEGSCLKHMREMVRQQLLGDVELMRDCIAGREDPELRLPLYGRIEFLRSLARELGLPEDPERRRQQRVNAPYTPDQVGIRLRLARVLLGIH